VKRGSLNRIGMSLDHERRLANCGLDSLVKLHAFCLRHGTSVQSWLLAERLAFSQRLLERTDQSVENVSDMAGFGSVVSLRHHFRRAFSVSPMTWRRNFGGPLTPTDCDCESKLSSRRSAAKCTGVN
jgi:AraC-like DNA-binding protein